MGDPKMVCKRINPLRSNKDKPLSRIIAIAEDGKLPRSDDEDLKEIQEYNIFNFYQENADVVIKQIRATYGDIEYLDNDVDGINGEITNIMGDSRLYKSPDNSITESVNSIGIYKSRKWKCNPEFKNKSGGCGIIPTESCVRNSKWLRSFSARIFNTSHYTWKLPDEWVR